VCVHAPGEVIVSNTHCSALIASRIFSTEPRDFR